MSESVFQKPMTADVTPPLTPTPGLGKRPNVGLIRLQI